MALSISPVLPTTTAQAATLDVALQSGTVVTAQVLKLLDASLVRIAIANLTLDVATTAPLQPGQTLQLAVARTASGLSLTPVAADPLAAAPDTIATTSGGVTPRGGAVILDDIPLAPNAAPSSAAKPVLTPLEARAVAVAAQTAATKQSGLSPLFANLTSAVASGALPQPVLVAAAQVLAMRLPRDQAVTGADIKAALTTSGLLSEASRASAAGPSQGAPDMKAALIVLRHTLATWLGETPQSSDPASTSSPRASPSPSSLASGSDASADSAARVTPTALPKVAAGAVSIMPDLAPEARIAKALLAMPAGEVAAGAMAAEDDAPIARNAAALPLASLASVPPPFRDGLPAAQSVAAPSLAPDAEPAAMAQHLIADTDGALARQTLLQVASLPDQMSGPRNDPIQPRWNFEIPFVTPQGTAMAQFEIARDGGGEEVEAAQRVWRARFSIDIEPAGPVHALISFSGDTTSVKMWAERPATAATLRASAPQLNLSLGRAALKTGDIIVADGAPVRAFGPRAGHFVNRAS